MTKGDKNFQTISTIMFEFSQKKVQTGGRSAARVHASNTPQFSSSKLPGAAFGAKNWGVIMFSEERINDLGHYIENKLDAEQQAISRQQNYP